MQHESKNNHKVQVEAARDECVWLGDAYSASCSACLTPLWHQARSDFHAAINRLAALASAPPAPAASLYEAIKHGDETHRAWLRKAIDAFYAGEPIPPVAMSAAPAASSDIEWSTIQVKGLMPLIDALDRADRKGYLPDALVDAWTAFEVRGADAI